MKLRYGLLLVLSFAMLILLDGRTFAEDQPDTVWLEPIRSKTSGAHWYSPAITQQTGVIISFDRAALRIKVARDQTETAIAADRVLWIERAAVSEKESALLALFAQRKRPESLLLLRDVLSEPLPAWRKQWLMMSAAHSMWSVSRDPSALQVISSMDSQALPPLIVAMLPVAWTRIENEPSELSLAQLKTNVASPEMQLVLVSWQLRTLPRDRSLAMIASLVDDPSHGYIGKLADVLRWRLATPQEVIENADRWESQVDALPMVLQVGPTLTLIEKFQAAGLADRAERLKLSLKLTPPFPHPDLPQD